MPLAKKNWLIGTSHKMEKTVGYFHLDFRHWRPPIWLLTLMFWRYCYLFFSSSESGNVVYLLTLLRRFRSDSYFFQNETKSLWIWWIWRRHGKCWNRLGKTYHGHHYFGKFPLFLKLLYYVFVSCCLPGFVFFFCMRTWTIFLH